MAARAAAHVTLAPPFVELGVPATVAFETPNERDGRVTTVLELTAPASLTLAAADAPPGWELELDGRIARWSGGGIEDEDTVSFPLVVTATGQPGTAAFVARQRYDDGRTVRWRASLAVLPARVADERVDRLDGRVIAGLVALGVAAGSVILILRLRRR